MYPPMAQVTSTWLADGDTMGYANLYSIPTGAYALVVLLVCGLLLLGVSHGKPDWSLLVLALAAGLLTVHEISQGSGYYFLPEALNSLLSWRGFDYLIPLLLLGYLLLNRKQGFLRWLGMFTLCTLALLALCAGASMLWGGAFSSYLREVGRQVSQGMYMELLTWATRYLVLASSTLSVLGLVRALGQLQAINRCFVFLQNFFCLILKLKVLWILCILPIGLHLGDHRPIHGACEQRSQIIFPLRIHLHCKTMLLIFQHHLFQFL